MWPDEWFQSVGVGTRTRWLGPKTQRSQPMWPHKCHITCRYRKRGSAGKNQTAVSWQYWSIKWPTIIRREMRLASSQQKQFCPGTYWWLDWATGNRTESCGPTFQFHTGLLAANNERQLVGIMYKHLSPQGVFSDMSARSFEKLQTIRGQNSYIGANISGD